MAPLRVAFMDRVHGDPQWILDALALHYEVQVDPAAPQVVFCGDEHGRQHEAHPDALKIWFQHENRYADFRTFHYVVGYRYVDSPRWFREPLYTRMCRAEQLLKDPGFVERTVRQKTKFCTLVASYVNPVRVWRRIELCDRLDAYRPLDYGGRWRNNIGGPLQGGVSNRHKLDFYAPYKFAVAIDNGCMRGYSTEKITDAFMMGCIPIFLGNPDIASEFNPKSFINAHECRTLAEVVERVKAIDGDEALYRKMLAEPWFHDNRPNAEFDRTRLGAFLHKAIESPRPPLYPVYPPYRLFDWTRKFNFVLDWALGKAGIGMWGPA